jgi:hypothetical protein
LYYNFFSDHGSFIYIGGHKKEGLATPLFSFYRTESGTKIYDLLRTPNYFTITAWL